MKEKLLLLQTWDSGPWGVGQGFVCIGESSFEFYASSFFLLQGREKPWYNKENSPEYVSFSFNSPDVTASFATRRNRIFPLPNSKEAQYIYKLARSAIGTIISDSKSHEVTSRVYWQHLEISQWRYVEFKEYFITHLCFSSVYLTEICLYVITYRLLLCVHCSSAWFWQLIFATKVQITTRAITIT